VAIDGQYEGLFPTSPAARRTGIDVASRIPSERRDRLVNGSTATRCMSAIRCVQVRGHRVRKGREQFGGDHGRFFLSPGGRARLTFNV